MQVCFALKGMVGKDKFTRDGFTQQAAVDVPLENPLVHSENKDGFVLNRF